MKNKKFISVILIFVVVFFVFFFKAKLSNSEEVQPQSTSEEITVQPTESVENVEYFFRNDKLLNEHYQKHGIEMGFASAEAYQSAASDVINNPNCLYKLEAEDNDEIFYLEATNEIVFLSGDGYIRTYFCPDSGINYFNKQ